MRKRIQREMETSQTTQKRLLGLIVFFGCVFLVFLGILFRYQILGSARQEEYILPAFFQRHKGVPITLPRGKILDRNGVPIHAPIWDTALLVFPESIKDKSGIALCLSRLLNRPSSEIYEELVSRRESFKLARELPSSVVETLLREPKEGLALVPEEKRYGPSSLACHVIGHIRPNGYFDPRDAVGEGGLEKVFQEDLSGQGFSWAGIVTSGQGDVLSQGIQVGSTGPEPKDLVTTLDISIQKALEDSLDRRGVTKGAGVVLDAKSGQVLAMASRPAFDQNHPLESMHDNRAPFINRAISSFPPGSTWKPVIVALALEKGLVSPFDTFTCSGQFKVGDRTVKCGQSKEGHGKVTIKEALAKSCNYAVSELALKMSPKELLDFALLCGFGQKTGIPLPDESSGVLPDSSSMLPGDIVNYAIGQGYLTVTPLQMASFFRAIVSGGLLVKPSLIAGEKPAEKRVFSKATADVLADALLMTTTGQEVTGTLAWVKGYGSVGKTGTAEVNAEYGKSHAWFCGWTPVIAPRYIISVIIEEGGEGSQTAAPLFREIAERILYPGEGTP